MLNLISGMDATGGGLVEPGWWNRPGFFGVGPFFTQKKCPQRPVDATIWETEWDTQVVPDYESFTYEPFNYNLTTDGGAFSVDKLKTMSGSEVDALVMAANFQLQKKFDDLMTGEIEDVGSFSEHVGKTPDKYNDSGNLVMTSGSGQSKEVMGNMIQNDIQKQRGEAAANAFFLSKPLWDSDSDNDGEKDGFFGAPSLKTLASIAITVAGGGPWLTFALNSFDTMGNVAKGNMSLEDGLVSVAKGAATTMVGQFTSGLTKNLNTSWTKSIGSFGGAALSSATGYAINEAASIGLDFVGNGFEMDKDMFVDRLQGMAIGAVAAGVQGVSAGITHGIMAKSGGQYKEMEKGKYGWDKKVGNLNQQWYGMDKIQKLGSLGGGLVEQGLNYAVGRDATFNVASLGMDVGFLEMSFNRKSGMNMQFGTGGVNVSASGLAQASEGASHIGFLNKMDGMLANNQGHRVNDKLDVVNMMGYSGDKTALATANSIINGKTHMMFAAEYQGQNGPLSLAKNQGYNDRDNNSFFLSDKLQSGNISDMALGAVVGSHEGAHLGFGNITEKQGLTKLYDVDVNVWDGLKKKFKGQLQNKELDRLSAMKKIADKAGNSDAFYDYVDKNYDTKDKTARRYLLKDISTLDTMDKKNSYVSRKMMQFGLDLFGKITKKSGNKFSMEQMKHYLSIMKIGDSMGSDVDDSVDAVGKYARKMTEMIKSGALGEKIQYAERSKNYNITYEMLSIYSGDMVKKHGKGEAMTMMFNSLVKAKLDYRMGTKYDRHGVPGKREFGTSVTYLRRVYDKGQRKGIYIPEDIVYSDNRPNVDCSGFINEGLSLLNEIYNAENAPIMDLVLGDGKSDKYSRDSLDISVKTMRTIGKKSGLERLYLMSQVNRAGVLVGDIGSRAAGHTWEMTGEWEYNRRQKRFVPMIIESTGGIGTVRRQMPNRYWRKIDIARRVQ